MDPSNDPDSLLPQSTPTKPGPLGTNHSIRAPNVETTRTQFRFDMKNKFIRLTYDRFMNEYIPEPIHGGSSPTFEHLFLDMKSLFKSKKIKELSLYKPFVGPSKCSCGRSRLISFETSDRMHEFRTQSCISAAQDGSF